MKPEELRLLMLEPDIPMTTLVIGTEIMAMMLHAHASPTNWLTLTPEQRNNSRRRANTVINDALHFWEGELRKRTAEK